MISAIGSPGLAGMHTGLEALRESANQIASARREDGSSARDVAKPLVDLKEGLRQVEASAKVFQSSHESVKSLIDVMA